MTENGLPTSAGRYSDSEVRAMRERSGLPWCFIQELLKHGFKPDTAWASTLPTIQRAPQLLTVYERLVTDDRPLQPYVYLWTSVAFYDLEAWQDGRLEKQHEFDLEPRSYPRISFVHRRGEYWEVSGGRVIKAGRTWFFEYACYRNTEWARHFRGSCDPADCRPCRQVGRLWPFATRIG